MGFDFNKNVVFFLVIQAEYNLSWGIEFKGTAIGMYLSFAVTRKNKRSIAL